MGALNRDGASRLHGIDESIGKRFGTGRQRKRRFQRCRHRNCETTFINDEFDVAADVRLRRGEMQAERRAGLIAADQYAEPIAGIARIIGASLNGSVLFAGNLGRRPRRCVRACGQNKAYASDEQTYRELHPTLFRDLFRRWAARTLPARNYQIVN
ncbi:MAG: hypothetical protein ACJ8FA_14795 [Xanthobacteraceae bacterium]